MSHKVSEADRASYRAAARLLVREGRRHLQITQTALGDLLDLSQGEVSRIEAGTVEPPIWFVMYLIHIFPDLLAAMPSDVLSLRRALQQQVDLMDAPAIGAILTLTRR